MISSNGDAQHILGPDGQPMSFRTRFDEFPIPTVLTNAWVMQSGWNTFMHLWDEAIKKNREDALAMRRDAWLMALLQERRLATASLNWHLEVDNEKDSTEKAIKDGLTKIVRCTPRLQSLMYYLLDATWFGRYGSMLNFAWEWMNVPVPDVSVQPGYPMLKSRNQQRRRCLVVKRGIGDPGHMPINGDKIGHQHDHTPYVLVNAAYAENLPEPTWPIWTTIAKAMPLRGWLRERFILHAHQFDDSDYFGAEMSEGIHGVGIRTFIYYLDFLKKEWISNISDLLERAALGIRLWYYQGGNVDSQTKISKAAKDNARRINILIPRYPTPRGEAVEGMEWKDAPTAGGEFAFEMIQWIDKAIERFIVGQTLSASTEGSGLGGTGVAELHYDTKSRIIRFDAANLADTLTHDFVRVIQKWTYPQYAEVPVRWVFDVDRPDPTKALEAIRTFVDMGGIVPEAPVRELTGIAAPEIGDTTLGQQQNPQQPINPEQQLGAPGGQPPAQQPELKLAGFEHDHWRQQPRDRIGRWTEEENEESEDDKILQEFTEALEAAASATEELYGVSYSRHGMVQFGAFGSGPWDEQKHPRGQPANRGQFRSKGQATQEAPSAQSKTSRGTFIKPEQVHTNATGIGTGKGPVQTPPPLMHNPQQTPDDQPPEPEFEKYIDMRSSLSQERAVGMERIGGKHSNGVYKIQLAGGKFAAFKPINEERAAFACPVLATREIAFFQVAQSMGISLVPETTMRYEAGKGYGSAQEWRDGAAAWKLPERMRFGSHREAAEMATLDYLCGAMDRHQGNWSSVAAFDNGYSFPKNYNEQIDPEHCAFLVHAAENNLPIPKNKLPTWEKLEQILGRSGIENEAIALMKERHQDITTANSFVELFMKAPWIGFKDSAMKKGEDARITEGKSLSAPAAIEEPVSSWRARMGVR